MTATIHWPTPSLNELLRWHWTKRRTRAAHIARALSLGSARQGGPTGPGKRRVTITRHSSRLLDVDNLVGGCKPVIDAMVKLGWLVDDSPEHVVVTYHQAKSTRKMARTEIEVV